MIYTVGKDLYGARMFVTTSGLGLDRKKALEFATEEEAWAFLFGERKRKGEAVVWAEGRGIRTLRCKIRGTQAYINGDPESVIDQPWRLK